MATMPKEEALIERLHKGVAIENGVEKESSGKFCEFFCEIHAKNALRGGLPRLAFARLAMTD